MEIQKIMVLVNSRAGMGRRKKDHKELFRWIDMAREKGKDIDIRETDTTEEGNTTILSRLAVLLGYDLIIAFGGDGTVNGVANGVVGSKILILPLQAGNCNDFSRSVGVPRDIRKALRLVDCGRVKAIDLGKVNGRVFVNIFGAGFDAKIVANVEVGLKKKWRFLPNTFLYLVALLRELYLGIEQLRIEERMYKGRRLERIELNSATLILVANGSTCGGGVFRSAPQADLRDGLLDICWVRKASRWRILRFLLRAMKGTHLSLPEVRTWGKELPRCRSLSISSIGKQKLICQIDGEIIPAKRRYRISVLPRALRVLAP